MNSPADRNALHAHLLRCHRQPGRAPPPALWLLSLRDLGWQSLSEGLLWSLQLQGTPQHPRISHWGKEFPASCRKTSSHSFSSCLALGSFTSNLAKDAAQPHLEIAKGDVCLAFLGLTRIIPHAWECPRPVWNNLVWWEMSLPVPAQRILDNHEIPSVLCYHTADFPSNTNLN